MGGYARQEDRREKEEADEDAEALDRLPPVYPRKRDETGKLSDPLLAPNDDLFLVKCQSQQSLIKQLQSGGNDLIVLLSKCRLILKDVAILQYRDMPAPIDIVYALPTLSMHCRRLQEREIDGRWHKRRFLHAQDVPSAIRKRIERATFLPPNT
ncbi:Uncharacterized protein DBV15_00744 [Temnothorax longispinosus]|uniref:Uncharacterized protein n=1 Tax=Temnothorax longispinosus TaxID=300112 RepID=A0A4S2KSD1_9HYME|nr:Uncharacterized protein DBV15_00744 [Temnothorax longispinosus]